MKQNNKKFNNPMHKFVGVLDKYVKYGPQNRPIVAGVLIERLKGVLPEHFVHALKSPVLLELIWN